MSSGCVYTCSFKSFRLRERSSCNHKGRTRTTDPVDADLLETYGQPTQMPEGPEGSTLRNESRHAIRLSLQRLRKLARLHKTQPSSPFPKISNVSGRSNV